MRNRDTKPEVILRRALWGSGMRYRLRSQLIGKPDIIFPGAKVAVFVDGDFWHGNAWRVRHMASFEEQFERWNNPNFWRNKILANMKRDETVNEVLRSSGWMVYRVFESRLTEDVDRVVDEIRMLVEEGRRHR
ncbi:very short patch repair endonuclease [Catellatospora sp. NEAU-YM18]|nr:very short patch repair endonuclease [Catellatospora tritici]